MKKIFTLGLGILMLASCSSDDSGSSIDASKLTKKWYYSTTKVLGQTFPYEDHEECGKDYIQFIDGGVFKDVDVWDCEEYEDVANWTLDGKKITLTFFGQSTTATIQKLTDTSLQVTYKDDFNEDGKDETVVQTYTSN